jgi:hypothetical protein
MKDSVGQPVQLQISLEGWNIFLLRPSIRTSLPYLWAFSHLEFLPFRRAVKPCIVTVDFWMLHNTRSYSFLCAQANWPLQSSGLRSICRRGVGMKGKGVPVHATKFCGGVIVYIYRFLTFALDRNEWSDSDPGHSNPGERYCGSRYVAGWVRTHDAAREIVHIRHNILITDCEYSGKKSLPSSCKFYIRVSVYCNSILIRSNNLPPACPN